ncbi:MAG: threonylcarbamoyl-AMP synthase [Nitrosopumilaceae archaeon]|nr:threonylcarbamoyl-AMP synthase [Nitrosopumilaceae archaeon]
MERVRCGSRSVERAAGTIRDGGVVAFPTDTVYGVGCDPYNREAVLRIYEIKGRDRSKPLPVLVASAELAAGIARMGPGAAELAARYWPGPLTIVLEVTDRALAASMGLAGSIGVRVPGGGCVSMLLGTCGMVVGTSANVSGEPSPVRADDVHIGCDMLLDGGAIPGGTESTIVDGRTDGGMSVVRQGALEVAL